MRVITKKHPTAIKGTMNHARTLFSKEMFAGALISVLQYLVQLWYIVPWKLLCRHISYG
jgi:hypothetical protein